MRHYAGIVVIAFVGFTERHASAVERPFGSSAWHTQAVAVFPNVTPQPPPVASFADLKPPPPPDPSLELLATNPYDAQLAAAMAAQNLYGDELRNPYTEEVVLANPYTDELRLENPYSRGR